jgi:hypothetical protein
MAELSEAELDRAVAERVMGWQRQEGYSYWMSFPAGETFNLHVLVAAWHPSTSIEFAMQVEDRIAELGLQNDYVAHLWETVGATRNGVNFWTADNFKAFWLCIHASAEQRCRAALAAIESKHE